MITGTAKCSGQTSETLPIAGIKITDSEGNESFISTNQFILIYPDTNVKEGEKAACIVAQASMQFIHEIAVPALDEMHTKMILDAVPNSDNHPIAQLLRNMSKMI